MQPFTTLSATALPLRTENVDTDQIIPARYLTAVTQDGMGDGLFSWWRYNRDGSPNLDFVLNQPRYAGSQLLIAGRNFGIGSSREHAVWALTQYGFRAVISPAFADIFYNNSLKNGLLPIMLPEETVGRLLDLVEEVPDTRFSIDLAQQTLSLPALTPQMRRDVGLGPWSFTIDSFRKRCLLRGLDDLGYLLDKEEQITAFEAAAPY